MEPGSIRETLIAGEEPSLENFRERYICCVVRGHVTAELPYSGKKELV